MTRNQLILIAAVIVVLLAMLILVVVVSSQVIDMLTPHPTWTGWFTPTQEGSIEPTRGIYFPTATPFGR